MARLRECIHRWGHCFCVYTHCPRDRVSYHVVHVQLDGIPGFGEGPRWGGDGLGGTADALRIVVGWERRERLRRLLRAPIFTLPLVFSPFSSPLRRAVPVAKPPRVIPLTPPCVDGSFGHLDVNEDGVFFLFKSMGWAGRASLGLDTASKL